MKSKLKGIWRWSAALAAGALVYAGWQTGGRWSRHARKRVRLSWDFMAPPDRVFELCTAFSDYPLFLEGVREMRALNPGHYRMRLGPRGEWKCNLAIEKFLPGQMLQWRSELGSPVQCSGRASFFSLPGGTTRLEVELEWRPRRRGVDVPARARQAMARMQELIETGSAAV